ncbi:cold and drought-regulated protein CORA-like [Vanessa cardui]|uniref:cold and drought-regulated protein CORA-like n=1 Tax=Vanessa cardui TaxID=171605 RepID=UPI001F129445|nr:cold and drought-regulated protein CORA-like [Vanessa cardui]
MACINYVIVILIISATVVTSENKEKYLRNISPTAKDKTELNNDLKPEASSYSHQYSDWGGSNPGGYGFSVTGYGTIDDKYSNNLASKGFDGYDNSLRGYGYDGHNNLGYNEVNSFGGNEGYGAYKGYGGNIPSGFNSNKFVPGGYSQSGYAPNQFGPGAYSSPGYPGYQGPSEYEGRAYAGNGGYGGFGGNGGLASYSGYNNPYYQGGGHLGYGYYNKKGGFGNIYSSGVTPSLVTGYRGYTRR